MILEYYIKTHLNIDRLYLADKNKRMWMQKLTRHATITKNDFQALAALGIELKQIEPKEKE